MKHQALILAFGVVSSFGLGYGFRLFYWPTNDRSLHDELSRMSTLLEALISTMRVGVSTDHLQPTSIVRTPTLEHDADTTVFGTVMDRLQDIENRLRELKVSQADVSTQLVPQGVVVPKNLVMVQDLIQRLKQSQAKDVSAELFCWTPQMVYKTYGVPDEVGASHGGLISWDYRSGDEPNESTLKIIFEGGYVVRVVM
ncbi:MAG: hypothetical protein U1E76_16935 [Planctomycetota bacterium]